MPLGLGKFSLNPSLRIDHVALPSLFVQSDVVEILITLVKKEINKTSLQSESPGSWRGSGLKLNVSYFEFLSVPNIEDIKGATFLWFSHGDGKLWGRISETSDVNYVLISYSHSAMKRGDVQGSYILSTSFDGLDIIHLWEPDNSQRFSSFTIRCTATVAADGRLDWLDVIPSFFSLPAETQPTYLEARQYGGADRLFFGSVQLREDRAISNCEELFNYNLQAVGGSLIAILGLLNMIDDTVDTIGKDMLQWPRRIVVSIAGILVDSSELKLKPHGKVTVSIVKANDLRNMEMIGNSDHYVVVYIWSLFKVNNKVNENNLNHRWNQMFELIVEDKKIQSIVLDVYDQESGQDKRLGIANLLLIGVEDRSGKGVNAKNRIMDTPRKRVDGKNDKSVKDLVMLLVEIAFISLGLSLEYHALLVRSINGLLIFSLPRPPEVTTDLEDKVNFKGGGMMQAGKIRRLSRLMVKLAQLISGRGAREGKKKVLDDLQMESGCM